MHLNRNDMINEVMKAFNIYEYKSVIYRRLSVPYYKIYMSHNEIKELNNIIKRLDNPMLSGYEFKYCMDSDFDKLMCRILYVSGKWELLSNYFIITNYSFKKVNVYIEKITDTMMELLYIFVDGQVRIHIDDENIGIKVLHTILYNREI